MTEKSKLSADMILVGKQLPVDVYHRSGMLLVKQGHYVLTPEQKRKLVEHGQLDNSATTWPAACLPWRKSSLTG